jgi:hypothetical protein
MLSVWKKKCCPGAGKAAAARQSRVQKVILLPTEAGWQETEGVKTMNCKFSLVSKKLESPKFSRHAGLDPASRRSNLPKRKWIPAFAGMTELKL